MGVAHHSVEWYVNHKFEKKRTKKENEKKRTEQERLKRKEKLAPISGKKHYGIVKREYFTNWTNSRRG